MNVLILEAKNGLSIPQLGGKTLHSTYDPIQEAQKLTNNFLSGLKQKTENLIVLGLGGGYQLVPLCDNYTKIAVFEPNQELIDLFTNNTYFEYLRDRIVIFSQEEELKYYRNQNIYILTSEFQVQKDVFESALKILKHNEELSLKESEYKEIRVLLDYPIYGGSLTTAEYVKTALEKLGCQVEFVNNSVADPLFQKILADTKYVGIMAAKLTELLSDMYWSAFETFKPHICIFMAQSPISTRLLETLKKYPVATAFWFVEDYRRFSYWQEYANLFDVFFTIQKDSFFDLMRTKGIYNFSYLPMAAEESWQKRIVLSNDDLDTYGSDVSFMGAAYPNRQTFFSHFLNYNLKLWGTGWEENELFTNNVQFQGRRISIEESVKIYQASKININLHSSLDGDVFEKEPDFINPRTFEIMACGGFQLVDERILLPEIFQIGTDIITFNSLEDCRAKINYYLFHDDERKEIAYNGYKKVLQEHTYTHRMKSMLQVISTKSTKLLEQLNKEKNAFQLTLNKIADPQLQNFLKQIPLAKRNDPEYLMEKIKAGTGEFKEYESILLILESFLKNE